MIWPAGRAIVGGQPANYGSISQVMGIGGVSLRTLPPDFAAPCGLVSEFILSAIWMAAEISTPAHRKAKIYAATRTSKVSTPVLPLILKNRSSLAAPVPSFGS